VGRDVIAHVSGMPVEELVGPIVLGAGALGIGVRALFSRRRMRRELFERRSQ
jgi:hypothetical protein